MTGAGRGSAGGGIQPCGECHPLCRCLIHHASNVGHQHRDLSSIEVVGVGVAHDVAKTAVSIELPVEVQRCCIDIAIIVRAASGLE